MATSRSSAALGDRVQTWSRIPRSLRFALVLLSSLVTRDLPLPSAILILCLAVPWWIWGIAQLPLLSAAVGGWTFWVGKILPLSLLLWAAWPAVGTVWGRLPESARSADDVQ